MNIQKVMVACATVLAAPISAGYAGPCSHEIDRMQTVIDAKIQARAAAGPTARETTAATMHRQPTPRSIAAAQTGGGDMEAAIAAVARARQADSAGDQSACEQALSDAQRAIGP